MKKTPQIKQFRISQLKAAKYNPRVISKEALAGLTKSIERFGIVEPIIVNTRGGANTVIGGHQRLKVLRRLRIKEVICITIDCSKKDEKLLNITLNNPQIQGEFIAKIGDYIDQLKAEIGKDPGLVNLRIEQLRKRIEEVKQFPEKELNENNINIENECPKCGYKW